MKATCLLLVSATALYPSSVSTIMGTDFIVIAADGREITVLPDLSTVTGAVCKVRCANAVCFAAAGTYDSPTASYDLWKIVDSEFKQGGTVTDLAKRFERRVNYIAPSVIKALRREEPDTYARLIKGTALLEWEFAGFERQGTIGGRQIRIGKSQILVDGKGVVIPQKIEFYGGEPGAVLLGEKANMFGFLSSRSPQQLRGAWSGIVSAKRLAQQMIEIEIAAAERKNVGQPITAVTITESNIRRDPIGACPQ